MREGSVTAAGARRLGALALVALLPWVSSGCDAASARQPTAEPVSSTARRSASPQAKKTAPAALPGAALFASRSSCLDALARLEPRAPGKARIASWNLRWFPDGVPGKGGQPTGIDLEWLACAIAGLRLDVVAVQEIKANRNAQRAAKALIARLDAHTKGAWRLELDHCPNPSGQHVGLLFDSARVRATSLHTYGALNPHGSACRKQLRPAFGAYLALPGGLDLHLLSVHLKSGRSRRDHELRRRSWSGLQAVVQTARRQHPDTDIVIAGDFNTMGCSRCAPPLAAEDELRQLDTLLAGAALRRLPSNLPCSQYHRRGGTLLDHIAVASDMQEVPAGATTIVESYCAAANCSRLGRPTPLAYQRLSDHCPVVLELSDADLD